MDDLRSIAAELREFKEAFRTTSQGLIKVVQVLAVQGEMLKEIRQAVTAPAGDASPLTNLLAKLALADQEHQQVLAGIAAGVGRIEQELRRG
jgi:hypothetical protein